MVQVSSNHYEFQKYVSRDRWLSYYHQVEESLSDDVKSILIIGIGDGIIPAILRNNKNINVITFDHDETLNPDYAGDISEILKIVCDLKVDVILCCQVLEHLEFSCFSNIIYQFSIIAKKKVIISLPYANKKIISIAVKLPKLSYFMRDIFIPIFWKTHKFISEHYWEIGKKKYPKIRIRQVLNKYFSIKKEYHVKMNPYHLFFILVPLKNL